jgi:hypothetical protein
MSRQVLSLLMAFAPLLLFVGCGGTSDVGGTVTYNGKPIGSGSVIVRAADGSVYTGTIIDGNYSVSGIPSGSVGFAVSSPDPATQPANPAQGEGPGRGPPMKNNTAPKKPTAGWFAIPAKFADPVNSGQGTTLKPGPNTFPITLVDK